MNTFISEILFPFFTIGATIAALIIVLNIRNIINLFANKTSLLKPEEADAIIIDMQETGLFINNSPQIKLQMQVIPDKGRNFIMETNHIVSVKELDNYKSGNKLKVKYFPGDHQRKPLIA